MGSPCLGGHYCEMAATGDPIKLRAVISINAIKANLPIPADLPPVPPIIVVAPPAAVARVPRPPASPVAGVALEEARELITKMKACPYRTTETGCGCGGMAQCALGKGKDGLVNHLDCFACLRNDGR